MPASRSPLRTPGGAVSQVLPVALTTPSCLLRPASGRCSPKSGQQDRCGGRLQSAARQSPPEQTSIYPPKVSQIYTISPFKQPVGCQLSWTPSRERADDLDLNLAG